MTEAELEHEWGEYVELKIPYEKPAGYGMLQDIVRPFMDDDHLPMTVGDTQYIFVEKEPPNKKGDVLISLMPREDGKWEIYSWNRIFPDIKIFKTKEEAEKAAVEELKKKNEVR